MSAYFDRDNVALPGMASYFRAASEEERTHAQELMDFQVCCCAIRCCAQQSCHIAYNSAEAHNVSLAS